MYYYDKYNNIYYNRNDALLSSNECKFYYCEKEFDLVDWKTEPQKSFKQLYKERAEWIRDNYEYVVLAYSGGIDSTNILESFYFNNITIDEILCVGAFSQNYDNGTDRNACDDHYLNAFPVLKSLNFPNTKITIFDFSENYNNPLSFPIICNNGNDWYKKIGGYYGMWHFSWNSIFEKYFNNKKTAIIFGIEKPFLHYNLKTNGIYLYYGDKSLTAYIFKGDGSLPQHENVSKINFYTSAESTDIMKKQAHAIIKFQKNVNKICNSPFSTEYFFTETNFWCESFLGNIIYPDLKNPPSHIVKKSSNNLFSVYE